jgi:hypothetical protein
MVSASPVFLLFEARSVVSGPAVKRRTGPLWDYASGAEGQSDSSPANSSFRS